MHATKRKGGISKQSDTVVKRSKSNEKGFLLKKYIVLFIQQLLMLVYLQLSLDQIA